MQIKSDAFKAYDIRGRVPEELNEEVAYRIGRGFVELFAAKQVVIGRDVRLSSSGLAQALARGFTEAGCDVIDIGLCGTEMVYFATDHLGVDGGVMVTASHNPMDYNGMKLVRAGARPISGDTGLRELEDFVIKYGELSVAESSGCGKVEKRDIMPEYIKHLLTYIDAKKIKPLKILVNAGNGCAGPVLDELEKQLPVTFIKLYHEPDGRFPHGIPNPLLPENRSATAEAVREHRADFGLAWDGDFDRCFFFDENGEFIEGYYIVGLLAEAFLRKQPGAKIIHDPRLTWNTIETVEAMGGIPVQSKTGHAFIKERMREEDAAYGGEMSAHHYFKEFAYCDSGMIPWLLVAENLCVNEKTMSQMVKERMAKFPVSGEINSVVANTEEVMKLIEECYLTEDATIDRTDGLSVNYSNWRFNLRMSNTEPLLRLNVETKSDMELMKVKTEELLKLIQSAK